MKGNLIHDFDLVQNCIVQWKGTYYGVVISGVVQKCLARFFFYLPSLWYFGLKHRPLLKGI